MPRDVAKCSRGHYIFHYSFRTLVRMLRNFHEYVLARKITFGIVAEVLEDEL